MTKTKLLIVEDDEDIRTQMKWALAADYEVVMAEDRAGANAAFTASHPSVALLALLRQTSLAWPPPLLVLAPSRRGEAELFNKAAEPPLGRR